MWRKTEADYPITDFNIGHLCSADNRWNWWNKCTTPRDAGWSKIYLAGWVKNVFKRSWTCKLPGSKLVETTVQRQTGERTKSSRHQDVCQKILWFYARCLHNLSKAALLYAENQHVTQSIATMQHHEEHPLHQNTNKRQKNRRWQIQDARTFAAPANKANSLLVQPTLLFQFSISTENQVKEFALMRDVLQ